MEFPPDLKPEKPKSRESSQEKLPFLSRLARQTGISELVAAMAFFAAMSGKPVSTEGGFKMPKEAQKQTQVLSKEEANVGLVLAKKETAKHETKPEFDFYGRFTKEEDGKLKSNLPWALIAPLQIEAGYNIKRREQAAFDVPYEYSRLFDTAKSLNPEDKDKVTEYIENKIKQQIANKLIFVDFSANTEKVYRAQHQKDLEDATKLIANKKIKNIRITGFASPEGPESKGPATLQPGAVDVENIKLAEKRAADVSPVLREALIKMGLSPNAIAEIKAEEGQFNDQELRDLDALAIKSGVAGRDETERLFNLIKDYNLNKFADDAELQKELNRIVGSKRKVEVTIDFEGEEKKKVVVPIPNPLFFLPLLLRRRKQEQFPAKPEDRPVAEAGPKPREIFTDGAVDFTKDLERNDPDFVNLFRDVEKNLLAADREKMEEEVLLDDIDVFIDDPEAIKRGVDYRSMFKELGQISDRYENEEKLEQGVCHIILTRWKEHDKKLRRELGIASDEGLDYHRYGNQVLWSRFHARELIRLVKSNPRAINANLDARVAELESRRMARLEQVPATPQEPQPEIVKVQQEQEKEKEKEREQVGESDKRNQYDIEFAERRSAEDAFQKELLGGVVFPERRGAEEIKSETQPETKPKVQPESAPTSKDKDRRVELELVMTQKAKEMKGLDPNSPAYREKEEQWNILRKESLALEPEPTKKEPEKQPKTQEKSKWSPENMDSWTFGADERLDPIKIEMIKNSPKESAKKESWLNKEKREKIWGWTKERLKGLATFGFWEVHRAEQFRSSKKKIGKELARKSEDIGRTKNLSLENAWDEALKIQANLALEGKPGGKEAKSDDYERLSNSISREKQAENQIYVAYLVKNAENTLRERLKKYKNELGKNVLDEARVKEAMKELKNKLLSLENGALETDTKDFSKVIKDKLDPKYWRRYIYGGAEAALGFAGWYWLSGKAASWWYGGGEAAKAAGGAAGSAAELPQEIPMDQHIWGTVKEYLTQNGVPNPTDQQIMEGSKIIAHDNGIGVKIWGIDGAPLDTGMQQGHLLKFGGLVKKLAWLKALG